MKHLLRAVCMLLCLAGLTGTAGAADMQMEFIALQHRPAEELIPIIKPFLRPDASITGTQYKLFIRTTPDNLAELREMITSLDAPPKPLLVTVTQNTDLVAREQSLGVSGSARLGDNARIITTDPRSGGTRIERRDGADVLRGRIERTDSRSDSTDTQTLQVLEGQPAMIRMGQSVPVIERTVSGGYYGPQVHDSLQYRDVTRGFSVLARTHGDNVTLEIHPHRDSLSQRDGGHIDTQEMITTVSGRLGEWLLVGGVTETVDTDGRGIVHRTDRREDNTRQVYIKVEALP